MKSKALWILVGIGSFLIILLMILSSVLDIGERLALISPVMSYIFYGLVAVLLFVLVLNPLRIILF